MFLLCDGHRRFSQYSTTGSIIQYIMRTTYYFTISLQWITLQYNIRAIA